MLPMPATAFWSMSSNPTGALLFCIRSHSSSLSASSLRGSGPRLPLFSSYSSAWQSYPSPSQTFSDLHETVLFCMFSHSTSSENQPPGCLSSFRIALHCRTSLQSLSPGSRICELCNSRDVSLQTLQQQSLCWHPLSAGQATASPSSREELCALPCRCKAWCSMGKRARRIAEGPLPYC